MFLASLPTYRAKDEGTRCGFCKQIFDTAKLSEESSTRPRGPSRLPMHNLDQREKKQGR